MSHVLRWHVLSERRSVSQYPNFYRSCSSAYSYNKQLLKFFPYPMTCTALHFAMGSAIALTMWVLRLHEKPSIQPGALKSVLPLAGIHVLGNVLTNVSLRAVAVSFTHTVKALEPFFSVIMSFIFLGDVPTARVAASLIPIVTGVGLASTSELSFNWTGFLAALGSNITFQSRNVLSKKFMLKGECFFYRYNPANHLPNILFISLTELQVHQAWTTSTFLVFSRSWPFSF